MKPLDPTWWRRHKSGEFYTQQNDTARLVKRRAGRRITGWILYVDGEQRGEWSSLAEAKQQAREITP